MSKNLSPLAEQLQHIILESDDKLQDLIYVIDPIYLRELNEAYPSFLSYAIKRQFGLLSLYDSTLENELHQQDLKALEEHLYTLSKELRYRQLKRLREENKNAEFKYIYGDYPCESDDVISYMQGMDVEEIYERRKKYDTIFSSVLNKFGDIHQKKCCQTFPLS